MGSCNYSDPSNEFIYWWQLGRCSKDVNAGIILTNCCNATFLFGLRMKCPEVLGSAIYCLLYLKKEQSWINLCLEQVNPIENNNSHSALLKVLIQLSSEWFYLYAHPYWYRKCKNSDKKRGDHQDPSTQTEASISIIYKRAEISTF